MNKEKMNESIRKLVGYTGFDGNGGVKSKETRVCNSKGKCHSPSYIKPVCSIYYVRVLNIGL